MRDGMLNEGIVTSDEPCGKKPSGTLPAVGRLSVDKVPACARPSEVLMSVHPRY
jgi:hypothetical protein